MSQSNRGHPFSATPISPVWLHPFSSGFPGYSAAFEKTPYELSNVVMFPPINDEFSGKIANISFKFFKRNFVRNSIQNIRNPQGKIYINFLKNALFIKGNLTNLEFPCGVLPSRGIRYAGLDQLLLPGNAKICKKLGSAWSSQSWLRGS